MKSPLIKRSNNKLVNSYIPSGSFFLIKPKELRKYKSFINKNNYLYLITEKKQNIDINNIVDWNLAKRHVN